MTTWPRKYFEKFTGVLANNDFAIRVTSGQVLENSFMSPSVDAFGRVRVSDPTTIFSSSSQYDKQPLLWVEKIVGTASSTHVSDDSSVDMDIGTASGDRIVNQTREYFRYQPGKSQQIKLTFCFNASQTGTEQLVGYGDDDNGIFLGVDGGGVFVLLRSKVTGTVSDSRKIYQDSWSEDKLDGTGVSGKTLDPEKAQIFLIDLEWLGVGGVRLNFVIDNTIIPIHYFQNANYVETTYMATANLPCRYEISNTAAVASSSTLKRICTEVEFEGGQQAEAAYPFASMETDIPINNGLPEVIFAARHMTSFNSLDNRGKFIPVSFDVMAEGGKIFASILYNPTITGGTWSQVNTNSIMESNLTATSYSGGVEIENMITASGTDNKAAPVGNQKSISDKLPYGLDIDGANPISLALVAWTDTDSVLGHFTFNWEEIR